MPTENAYSDAEINDHIDEFLDRLEDLQGTVLQSGWNETANHDQAGIFLNGLGDVNPRWDPDEGAVHPAFPVSVSPPGISNGPNFDHNLEGFIADIELFWSEPIRVGDPLEGDVVLDDVYEKGSREDKRYVFEEGVSSYTRDGVEVARGEGTVIRMHVDESEGLLYDKECYEYSEDELAELRAAYDEELERLETVPETPDFSDVSVGDTLPTRLCGPLTIGDIVAWNAAKGAPSWGASIINYRERLGEPQKTITNPLTGWQQKDSHQHSDWVLAEQRGMPLPLANGVHMYVWTTPFVTNWMGADGFLERHRASIEEPYFYGDVLWTAGEVTATHPDERTVDIEWEATNQEDRTIMTGSSTVHL